MKKLISLISSFLLITIVSANAEMGIGISGAAHMFDATGTETTRQSNQKNSGDHSETVVVPEILGVQHVTLATLESLNSGATYPNKDLFGGTIGLGTKGDIPYGNNLYYKTEVTYTNFETYEADGAGNKVVADLEDIAARLSIGYKF